MAISGNVLYVLPFGEPEAGLPQQGLLQHITSGTGEAFGIRSEVGRGLPVPDDCLDARRNQYGAQGFLETLKWERQRLPREESGFPLLLGVTRLDLFVPRLNFVFGVADQQGGVAVISLKRLDPVFYGEEPDRELLETRALKEAIHEIGHLFELAHCADSHCIMHFSITIRDTDGKGPGFCSRCAELIHAVRTVSEQ